MKIMYMGIIKNFPEEPAAQLTGEIDVSSFALYKKPTARTFIAFFGVEIAGRTKTGQRQSVDETQAGENFRAHSYARSEGIAASLVTDQEYPPLAAQQILSKILDEFVVKYPRSTYESYVQRDAAPGNPCPLPSLKEYMKTYQDPKNIDNIMKIQQELDETKIVLHKTIENVLERGEKIDDLVQKSNNLSESSKKFYTASKKQNSCCTVM